MRFFYPNCAVPHSVKLTNCAVIVRSKFAIVRSLCGQNSKLCGYCAFRITVIPPFTGPPFTVSTIYRASFCFPKYRVYKQTNDNVNPTPIYRAPLFTVYFPFPPRGTVNGGITVYDYYAVSFNISKQCFWFVMLPSAHGPVAKIWWYVTTPNLVLCCQDNIRPLQDSGWCQELLGRVALTSPSTNHDWHHEQRRCPV